MDNGSANELEQFFKTTPYIPSGPGALLEIVFSRIFLILEGQKSISYFASSEKSISILYDDGSLNWSKNKN